ncbi:unnamed protein product [Meganyctiphanes norvegica]|uniref:RING-CH-type domain-containing protein n=1 Tax=Meganyctiphanes norvegica TaxID=48144 RepID=A0AAV2QUI4_MEGNR
MDKSLNEKNNNIMNNNDHDINFNNNVIENDSSKENLKNVSEEMLSDNSCENEKKIKKKLKKSVEFKIDMKKGNNQSDSDLYSSFRVDDYMCVFCLEYDNLIQFCYCSVVAHKECVIKYISVPGIMNDKCCMCRRKLEYDMANPNAPMKKKYILLLSLIIAFIAIFAGLSICAVISLIPIENKSIFVYICIVSNISMTWSLMLLLVLCIAVRFGTRSPCRRLSDDLCNCVNEEFMFCELCDMEGISWSILILVLYFIAVFLISVIGAIQVYCIIYVIFKFYKSFDLKSKGGLKFEQERKVVVYPNNYVQFEKNSTDVLIT